MNNFHGVQIFVDFYSQKYYVYSYVIRQKYKPQNCLSFLNHKNETLKTNHVHSMPMVKYLMQCIAIIPYSLGKNLII